MVQGYDILRLFVKQQSPIYNVPKSQDNESRPMGQTQSKPIPGEVRRRRMLSLIEDRGFMRVGDLSSMFGVSEVTARSDLDQLAEALLVDRVHGGAMAPSRPPHRSPVSEENEPSFEESVDTLADEKASIGRAAAALVSSGDSIIIDVGTTATAVARALTDRADLNEVVAFTNGLTTAMQLETAIPRFTVILTGGTLRPRQHSLVNPMGGGILDQINATIAFIGCNGIHADEGVTNINLPEAQIKSRMIGAAGRVVVVADGTKIGKVSVARIARMEDVDNLVTTASADEVELDRIRNLGVYVTVTS
jgi:DeoR family transcriptional regulator of aga operon